jgi:hypothetical protein
MCDCLSYNLPEDGQKTPEVVLRPKDYFKNPDMHFERETICVDACIADVVKDLWRVGIWTHSSCCGHGNPKVRSVVVDQGDRAAAMEFLAVHDPSIRVAAWELIWTDPVPRRAAS